MPYESLTAFAAKFCRLNGIGYKDFRRFLEEITGEYNWETSGFKDVGVSRLATLLDEKRSLVKTLGPTVPVLHCCCGTFDSCRPDWDDSYHTLSYCRTCVSNGYHASFHRYHWLKKCPIHLEDLVTTHQMPFSGGSNFDRCAEAVGQLLDQGTAGRWLSIGSNQVMATKIPCARLRRLLHWIAAVRQFQAACLASSVVQLGHAHSSADLSIVLGRIAWAVPPHKCLVDLFQVPPETIRPKIVDYPNDVVTKLTSLFSDFDHDLFIFFYKVTNALANEMPRYRELLLRSIKNLEIEFGGHAWRWGLSQYRWVAVNPEGWPYWQVATPLDAAIEELRSRWGETELRSTTTGQRDAWLRYIATARELQMCGLVNPMPTTKTAPDGLIYLSGAPRPVLRFNLDKDVAFLIEDILYEEASAEVTELTKWLRKIADGAVPYKVPRVPPIGNLFVKSGGAYLMTWPTVPAAQ